MPTHAADRPDPFATLNAEQRSAVEHGLGAGRRARRPAARDRRRRHRQDRRPWRTAWRTWCCDGADPQRILLLTFTRRAAQEMTRRARPRAAAGAGAARDAARRRRLPWAGTFHAIGAPPAARLRRRDRPGAELHDPRPRRRRGPDGPGAPRARPVRDARQRFPAQGHLPGDLLARGQQRSGRSTTSLQAPFPWCADWEDELKQLFARLRRAQAAPAGARLRRPAAVLAHADGRRRRWPRAIGARFDHVLVDEYQDTNRLQAEILLRAEARRPRPHGGRRRRAVDLRVSRRRRCATSSTSRRSSSRRRAVVTLEQNYRSTQPILDAVQRA